MFTHLEQKKLGILVTAFAFPNRRQTESVSTSGRSSLSTFLPQCKHIASAFLELTPHGLPNLTYNKIPPVNRGDLLSQTRRWNWFEPQKIRAGIKVLLTQYRNTGNPLKKLQKWLTLWITWNRYWEFSIHVNGSLHTGLPPIPKLFEPFWILFILQSIACKKQKLPIWNVGCQQRIVLNQLHHDASLPHHCW